MEPKKNPRYDVHRYRSALFSVGLITGLTLMILAFAWRSEMKIEIIDRPPDVVLDDPYPEVIPDIYVVEKQHQPEQRKPSNNFVEVKNNPTMEDDTEDIVVEPPTTSTLTALNVSSIVIPVDSISDEPFRFVEQMPAPEGGLEGFYKTLKKNLTYPPVARRHQTMGRVFVEFTITKTGALDNFKVVKSVGDGCDEEAIRVIKLTKWNPGKQRGVPVNVRVIQAINFTLR